MRFRIKEKTYDSGKCRHIQYRRSTSNSMNTYPAKELNLYYSVKQITNHEKGKFIY